MVNNNFLKSFITYIIYFISALYFSITIDISMPDDGLRHISFAYNTDLMKSWGDVFPYSLFTNYDPWFGWHYLLRSFSSVIPFDSVHIYINVAVLFLLMLLLHRFTKEYVKYKLDSLIYIIVLLIVVLSSYRYVMVRPDLLSGLFIMYALLLKNRFLPMFLLTLIYAPFYYLFFMYTGSIGLVLLVQQRFKSFFGVLSASILALAFFLFHDSKGYIETVKHILTDQELRMGLAVKEGEPIFSIFSYFDYFILLPTFLFGAFFIIYKNYNYFKLNSLATFLIITSILWINQARYYHLFMPIIFVYTLSVFFELNKKRLFYNLRKVQLILKRYFSYSKNKRLFYLIAIPYAIFVLGNIYSVQSVNNKVEKSKVFDNPIYDNKTILSNKMDPDMFGILYYNPKIKTIPSCSIGWFKHENSEIKNLYVKMNGSIGLSEEELNKLIKSVNADFYFHYTNESTEELDFSKLYEYGIIPKTIHQDKIIFEIKK